jgi:hypothetical protein
MTATSPIRRWALGVGRWTFSRSSPLRPWLEALAIVFLVLCYLALLALLVLSGMLPCDFVPLK